MLSASDILARVEGLKARYQERQADMKTIKAIREGKMGDVHPGLFPPEWPRPLVANFIDVAAQDFADILAPLPGVDCSSATMATDTARRFAEKRTRIARGYISQSQLSEQQFYFANYFVSYAAAFYVVEPDFKKQAPCIYVIDPVGCYATYDRLGNVVAFAQTFKRRLADLIAEYRDYPEVLGALLQLEGKRTSSDPEVEIVRWYDKDQVSMLCVEAGVTLSTIKNPISRCWVVGARRPGLCYDKPRGQFDDIIGIQFARAKSAIYALDAMEESVNAPIAVPDDLQEFPLGPKALLKTSQPQNVQRVPLNIPNGVFAELQNFDNELRRGARYPEGRTGNIDASIITGEGVQALMGTFDSQTSSAQLIFAHALEGAISRCFEMDEALWGNVTKTVRGMDKGSPFELTYRPSKDIKGDYTCHVTYGMAAGLDPNRALVFFLQAQGAGLVSKKRIRENLPFDINLAEEEQAIDIETMRTALQQSVAATAQAIPMLASQGQDPSMTIQSIATAIKSRMKGKAIEDAVLEAFTPPEPEPGAEDPLAQLMAAMGGGGAGGAPAGGGAPGVPTGRAEMPGSARDLLMTLAGTTPSGNPNLAAAVSRRVAV